MKGPRHGMAVGAGPSFTRGIMPHTGRAIAAPPLFMRM